jgi:hypothetical protein
MIPFLDVQKCRLIPSETVRLMMRLIEEDGKYIHNWA